jgi:hypothetical protein
MHTMAFMTDEDDLQNNWFTQFSASIKSRTLVSFPRSVAPIAWQDGAATASPEHVLIGSAP